MGTLDYAYGKMKLLQVYLCIMGTLNYAFGKIKLLQVYLCKKEHIIEQLERSLNKRLAFRRPFGRLQGYGLLGRSGYALAPTQASTHIFAALRTQKPGKNGFKAFGLAYSGSKNVANLGRYVKYRQNSPNNQ